MKQMSRSLYSSLAAIGCWLATTLGLSIAVGDEFKPLFPTNGVPFGWTVRAWDDVRKAGTAGAWCKVENGVLQGSERRGTWLMSEREYGDFVLEFEFKLGERGNSGCALRAPMRGDPAFDGIELQMADVR